MAKNEQVLVPDIGDFGEVDVVEVLVAAGDTVAVDDSLIVLESDKATMDVPSPTAGKVAELKIKAGDQVAQGDLILVLEVDESTPSREPAEESKPAAAETAAPSTVAAPSASEPVTPEPATPESATPGPATPGPATPGPIVTPSPVPEPQPLTHHDHAAFTKAYASPAVRRFARELGVDLARIQGTGRKHRILKEDVQNFVKQVMADPQAGSPSGSGSRTGGLGMLPEMPVIDFSKFGAIERQPLSRIQKIAGPNLHRSWLHVPHVTQHDTADITEMEAFRKQHSAAAKEQGFSLTPLAFVMKAAVATLKQFPAVNSSLDPDGEQLILKRYYHVGVAVDTPGGLVVPVVRDVDQKGLFELAQELRTTSVAAREGKLKPDQVRGASFTISSLGGIGGTFFTPIVNAPEVAILGVSRSEIKPVWNGEEFAPRLILPLSLSYDHRVIDGAMAVRFTTYLAEVLSDLRRLLL